MANNAKRKEATNQDEASSLKLKGLSKDEESGRLVFRGIQVSEMLAYPITLAALLIGKSRGTIWRATARGDLASKNGLVSKEALQQYAGFQISSHE